MERNKIYAIQEGMKKDIIEWWEHYLPRFNGTASMWLNDYSTYDEILATDASITGAGALM